MDTQLFIIDTQRDTSFFKVMVKSCIHPLGFQQLYKLCISKVTY